MRAIIFDVGNTLVWLDHPFVLGLLAEHGIRADEEELLAAQYGAKLLLDELVRTGAAGDDAVRGRVFFAEIFRALGVPRESFPALEKRLWARHRERNLWSAVQDGTAEVLEELRGRGHTLGVISNADGRVEALLEELRLRPYFDFVLDSAVVGVEKPDPRIFRMGCRAAGVDPGEAVYVGDVYEIDVVGAREAGMHAVLLDPLDRFADLDCERIRGIHELPERLAEGG